VTPDEKAALRENLPHVGCSNEEAVLLLDALDQAEAQVAAVRARHVKDPVTGRCLIDSEPYPCVTALDTGVQS
jgi:hypothetical protein